MNKLPAEPVLVSPLLVYYYDSDAGGVVHNAAYLRLIEKARTDFAESLGWPLSEMRDTGLVPVVARTEIDYLKPARIGENLEIETRLAGMEKIRFFMEFTVRRPADGAVIARCRQTMVTVQLPAGRPKPVPKPWREKYPHLVAA